MAIHFRLFRRFTTYFLLLAVAGVLSLFGQKRDDETIKEYSLIPSAPMAHADTPVDGGGLDTESSACATASTDATCSSGAACTDSADGGSADGGCSAGDGCCGSGE